jgi:hypothetical protein
MRHRQSGQVPADQFRRRRRDILGLLQPERPHRLPYLPHRSPGPGTWYPGPSALVPGTDTCGRRRRARSASECTNGPASAAERPAAASSVLRPGGAGSRKVSTCPGVSWLLAAFPVHREVSCSPALLPSSVGYGGARSRLFSKKSPCSRTSGRSRRRGRVGGGGGLDDGAHGGAGEVGVALRARDERTRVRVAVRLDAPCAEADAEVMGDQAAGYGSAELAAAPAEKA